MTTSAPVASDDHSFVLIVDDEEGVRESLRDVVEMVGCSAFLAANAEDGLALLVGRRPCLVVLDLLLPGMSGAEMLDSMRRDPALSGMPVLISTSAPERAPRNVPVLPKPINIDALCAWIKRSCRCGD
jgi:DNA-binding response OmpR family regulator